MISTASKSNLLSNHFYPHSFMLQAVAVFTLHMSKIEFLRSFSSIHFTTTPPPAKTVMPEFPIQATQTCSLQPSPAPNFPPPQKKPGTYSMPSLWIHPWGNYPPPHAHTQKMRGERQPSFLPTSPSKASKNKNNTVPCFQVSKLEQFFN